MDPLIKYNFSPGLCPCLKALLVLLTSFTTCSTLHKHASLDSSYEA